MKETMHADHNTRSKHSGATINVTTFARDTVTRGIATQMTESELRDLLRDPPEYASKKACPLMRPGKFTGNSRAAGAVLETAGAVVADYDAGVMPVAEAAKRLRAAGIQACIYTSGSHQVLDLPKYNGGPRWRVVAPLSAPIDESAHEALMNLLNGALGGVLGRESWDWKRCYYFGRVQGVPYEFETVDGAPLDVVATCPDFEPIPAAKAVRATRQIDRSEVATDCTIAQALRANGRTLGGNDRGVYCHCPRAHEHTADSGPTATIWMFATGSEPAHIHCSHTGHESMPLGKVTNAEFLKAEGLDDPIGDFSVSAQVGELLPNFERLKNGKVNATRNNLAAVLARPDLCGIHLRRDSFANAPMWAPVDRPNEWRAFTESDLTDLCTHIESGAAGFTFGHVPSALAGEMAHNFAEHNQFDSAQDWLGGLRWDGVERVDQFLVRHLRADDTVYTRAVGRYLLTALAGRTLEPGVKADMVPVFVGPQGGGKSSVVAALAPSPDHFLELDLEKSENDRLREMCGRLVVELGELRGLRAREHTELKQFISRRVDSWVPKYREAARNYPRRSVFIGTTNNGEFLSDDTGNRRWLPVDVLGHPTPHAVGEAVAAVVAERDQLWAEAAVIFRRGGIAWLEAEKLAKFEHSRFEVAEPWAANINQWLEDDTDGAPFTTEQVLVGAIRVELRAINDFQRKRVASALRKLGYADRRQMLNGVRGTFWHRVEEAIA